MKINILSKIIAGALVAGGGISAVTVAAIKFSKTEDDSQTKVGDTQESQRNVSAKANDDGSQQATGVVNESDGAKTEQIQNTDNEQKNTNSDNSSSNQSQISNEQTQVAITDTTTVSKNESENNTSNGQTQISATDNENGSKSITVETQLTSVAITESGISTTGQIKNNNNEQTDDNSEIVQDSVIQTQDSSIQNPLEIVQDSTNGNGDNLSNGQTQAETTTTNAYSKIKNEDITFFVFSKKLSSTISEELNNNYQCKFTDRDAFDCVIAVPQLDTTLNHSKISKFMQDDTSAKTLTKEELKKDDNIYKITIKQSDATKINWTSEKPDGSIEIDLVSKNNTNHQFAKLGILFVMKGNEIHEQAKINDFIFKSNVQTTIKTNDSETCSFTTTSDSANKNCRIFDLTENSDKTNLSTLTFSPNFHKTQIEHNQHYWISLAVGLEWSNITNITIKTGNETIHISDFKKAKHYQTSSSNSNNDFRHLFILEETAE